jgi:N6-adenosine-specific RNA methylase IME4
MHLEFNDGPFAGLPRGHYRVAYVDPPWRFYPWSHRGDGKGACQHYECMSLESVCALPVKDLMAPDAALFLWAVQPMLPEAMRVISAWGFEFRTVAFVWVKMPTKWTAASGRIRPRLGLGYHTRSGAEQCWLATRNRKGKKPYIRQSNNIEQVLHAPIRAHSRKPDEFITRIERLVGDVPRIELFARTQRPGWAAWGNEIDKYEVPSHA